MALVIGPCLSPSPSHVIALFESFYEALRFSPNRFDLKINK